MSVQGPEVTGSSGGDKDREPSVSDAVSLCGAVDFGAVKLLLSQWLQSCHSECQCLLCQRSGLTLSLSICCVIGRVSHCHLASVVSKVRSYSVT